MGTTEEMLSIILNLALWQLFSESFKAIAIHLLICLTSYSYSILNSLIIPFPTLAPITTLRFPSCIQVTITMQLIKRFYSLGGSLFFFSLTPIISLSNFCIKQNRFSVSPNFKLEKSTKNLRKMSMKKHWNRIDTKHLLLSVPSEVNLF